MSKPIDARGMPAGTLVTCEHCVFPHPKDDAGVICRFPKLFRAPAPGSASPPEPGCGADRCDGRCRSDAPPKLCDACGKGTCATWFGIDGKARCWMCEVARG